MVDQKEEVFQFLAHHVDEIDVSEGQAVFKKEIMAEPFI